MEGQFNANMILPVSHPPERMTNKLVLTQGPEQYCRYKTQPWLFFSYSADDVDTSEVEGRMMCIARTASLSKGNFNEYSQQDFINASFAVLHGLNL